MSTILFALRSLLTDQGIAFREVHHAPTVTSEESARARGETLDIGGKALVLKVGDRFNVFVLSAARKLDSSAIKRHFGEKRVRFATAGELMDLTGLVPGSVPPFGRPILPFDLFVDPSVVANDRIAFNAGSLTDSMVLSVADYLSIARPTLIAFSQGE